MRKNTPIDGVIPRSQAQGFTLIELMIGLTLGLLVLAGLATIFARTYTNQSDLDRTVRRMENSRYALDIIGEELAHAGYFGDFNPATLSPTYTITDPCETAVSPVSKQGWSNSPFTIPVPLEGISTSSTSYTCLSNRRSGTQGVIVRHADLTGAVTVSASSDASLYLQVSRCPTDTSRVLVAKGGDSSLVLKRPGSSTVPDCSSGAVLNDSVRRILQRAYYVADCNDCSGAGDQIPTLKRIEVKDGVLINTSIAEGVEYLVLEYGLDTNSDGVIDAWKQVTDLASATEWAQVLAVRVHLLVRNTESTNGYADSRTYRLGSAVSVSNPVVGYKRTILSSTISLNNVAGRLE